MRAERADVVIIGAGLAGSAAARALASRGRSVVLVEAFQPGHRRGSSHGSARIFRRAYPDPLYVRLTGQAQVLWRQLSDEAGEEFVTITGAIDYGPVRVQEKMYEIMTGFGVPAELMTADAAADGDRAAARGHAGQPGRRPSRATIWSSRPPLVTATRGANDAPGRRRFWPSGTDRAIGRAAASTAGSRS